MERKSQRHYAAPPSRLFYQTKFTKLHSSLLITWDCGGFCLVGWVLLLFGFCVGFFFSLPKSVLDVFINSLQFVLSILKYGHQKQAYHFINSLPLSSWKIGSGQWKAWNTRSSPPDRLPCELLDRLKTTCEQAGTNKLPEKVYMITVALVPGDIPWAHQNLNLPQSCSEQVM